MGKVLYFLHTRSPLYLAPARSSLSPPPNPSFRKPPNSITPETTESIVEETTESITQETTPEEVDQAMTLASGDWVNKSYDIHGNWEIVERDGTHYIMFDDDFRTRSGPDLKVYLSLLPLAALNDRTVAPSSVEISPLKAPRGRAGIQNTGGPRTWPNTAPC